MTKKNRHGSPSAERFGTALYKQSTQKSKAREGGEM